MATNRWYTNSTNTILDLTGADAADVENKCDDIAVALDLVEAEFDALSSSDDLSIKLDAVGETPELTLTANLAARAGKFVAFNESGDISLQEILSTESLAVTIVGKGETDKLLLAAYSYWFDLTPDSTAEPIAISRTPVTTAILPGGAEVGDVVTCSTNEWAGYLVAQISPPAGEAINGASSFTLDLPVTTTRFLKTGATEWSTY
jgi:hypothetical protein